MEIDDAATGLDPYSDALFHAVMHALPKWLTGRLAHIAPGTALPVDAIVAATVTRVHGDLLQLLRTDVDRQRDNPLHVLRASTSDATEALEAAGVAHPHRDEFETRAMPDDVYSIGRLTWRDLSEDVHETGITWGAWKAATILTRRRDEGKLK